VSQLRRGYDPRAIEGLEHPPAEIPHELVLRVRLAWPVEERTADANPAADHAQWKALALTLRAEREALRYLLDARSFSQSGQFPESSKKSSK
jgi:hypothetical protein